MPHPSHKNLVRCKWVYKLKFNSVCSISRYNVRLVAKGSHQQLGLDYSEAFSPVVKLTIVRFIIALAVSCHWSLRQLDISNAFLHGIFQKEVYMQQPPDYVDASHPDYVCRLHRIPLWLETGFKGMV